VRNQFSKNETEFLKSNYIARIATCSNDLIPHVTPIYFANDRSSLFFASEKRTKKYSDIVENSHVSLVVDVFDADWLHGPKTGTRTTEKAIVISGIASIRSRGMLYNRMYKTLFQKYPDYRTSKKWLVGELPIVRVSVRNILSWGLN
jgi:uncharacterized pyridoxamine 5'-phosphate oxidase family protein